MPEAKPRLGRPILSIGQEFTYPETGHVWRVTDIGTRTFVAIDVTKVLAEHGNDHSWFNGPPYAICEEVWDEYDAETLRDIPEIEWGPVPTTRSCGLVRGGPQLDS